MAELKIDEAKKDLEGLVQKAKAKQEEIAKGDLSAEEIKKLEDDKKKADEARVQQEAKSKRNLEILNASDEDIKDPKKFSDEERAKRTELLEARARQEEANLSAEEKIKRVKDESQKRIDEIKNELLQVKDKSSKEAETLRAEIKTLESKITAPVKKEDDIPALAQKDEEARITKYLEEDKDKPREQRREMSEEELDEWQLEEPAKAQRWISRNELRRDNEKRNFIYKTRQNRTVKAFLDKVDESAKRAETKHPELNVDKRRTELKAQGKSDSEIFDIINDENPKVKVLLEVMKDHPELITVENGPEFAVAEMEKRLASPKTTATTDEKDKKIDELTTKVEELSTQVAALTSSDEGIPGGFPPKTPKVQLSEQEKNLVEIMNSRKASQKDIDSALKKLRERKGT